MTSPRTLPYPLPGGPLGDLSPSTVGTTGLLIPEIEVHVRAPDLTLLGEITAWTRCGGTLRYNNVSDWALTIDLDDKAAAYLQTPKYGLHIIRRLLTERGVVVPGTTRTLFSGDVKNPKALKAQNQLQVSFKSDLWRLRNRPAFPVTFYPYNIFIGSRAPIRFYPLNENAGTTAADYSESEEDGSYVGDPTLGVASILGDDNDTCVTLDGVDDYVDASTVGLPTGSAPFSVSVWSKPLALGVADSVIIWAGNSVSSHYVALLMDNTGAFYATNGSVSTPHSTPYALDTAYRLTLVWDGTAISFMVNGTTTGSIAATMFEAYGGLRLGASNAGDRFYHGAVSKWEFYDYALTEDAEDRAYKIGNLRFAYADSDDRAGHAETVIKEYAAASIGPDALPLPVLGTNLSEALVEIAGDLGRGADVQESARIDLMVTDAGDGLLQRLGQNGGVGFDITQFGNQLTFDCYEPNDVTSDALFSDDLGNLADYTFEDQAPDSSQGGNVVIVMGGGVGIDRVFRFAADTASVARWGVIMGVPVDARDTTDTTVLDQRATDALSKSAEQVGFTSILAQTAGLAFGRDFWLGDKVTVILRDGSTIQDLVREVALDYTADQGEVVIPAIGTPSTRVVTGDYEAFTAFLRRQVQQTQARLARLERAQ